MNLGEREEFDLQLAILCAGMDVPCTAERKEAYWKSLKTMSLIQFMRTVEHILEEEAWTKIPKPSQVWDASKRMRASAPQVPVDDGFRGDIWDEQANLFLVAHLRQQLALNSKRYGQGASFKLMRAPEKDIRELGLDMKTLDASASFVANVERFVHAKNLWAADMRDMATKEGVPVETQQAVWRDYIERAEARVSV